MEKFNPYSEEIKRTDSIHYSQTDPEIVSKLNEIIDEINKINERLNEHEKAGGHIIYMDKDTLAQMCVDSMDWDDE